MYKDREREAPVLYAIKDNIARDCREEAKKRAAAGNTKRKPCWMKASSKGLIHRIAHRLCYSLCAIKKDNIARDCRDEAKKRAAAGNTKRKPCWMKASSKGLIHPAYSSPIML
jgi:hypothetical protein